MLKDCFNLSVKHSPRNDLKNYEGASVYSELRSTFLRTRRITAKVPPTITVNRYASQNIHLPFYL